MSQPRLSWINRTSVLWSLGLVILLPLVYLVDDRIHILLKVHRLQVLYILMSLLTGIGKGWFLMVVALILSGIGVWKGREKLKTVGARALIALVASAAAVTVIKHGVGRARPRLMDQGILHWGPSLQIGFDSFPSGHATSAFAMAAVLSFYYPAYRWIWYSTAVLVAFTRVYIGAHFVTDVLAGAALGALLGVWAVRMKLEYLKS